MAGGDYDGGLDMFSFHGRFVDIVRRTEAAVRRVPVEEFDAKVKGRLAQLEKEEVKKEGELTSALIRFGSGVRSRSLSQVREGFIIGNCDVFSIGFSFSIEVFFCFAGYGSYVFLLDSTCAHKQRHSSYYSGGM